MRILHRFMGLFLGAFLLSGCMTELYSNLPEQQANEMLAVLVENDIPTEKQLVKTTVTLMVQKKDLARAIEVLSTYGYPQADFDNLGTLFAQQGLISSPTEEQIRYIYGLSQELSHTITQIDGVLYAQVQLVMSSHGYDQNKLAEPSTASVMIKYNPTFNIEPLTAQIKMLVANSVSGLTYDRVSVVMFPATVSPKVAAKTETKLGSISKIKLVFALGLGTVLIGAILLGAWFTIRRGRQHES